MQKLENQSYANFGRRLGAYLVDSIVVISIVFVAAAIIILLINLGVWMPAATAEGGSGSIGNINSEELWNSLGAGAKLSMYIAGILAIGPLYFVLCHSSPWQATFGKRYLNIYVTDKNGGRISIMHSFGRWIVKIIQISCLLWPISIITIVATKQRKGLHDFVAQTLVLNGRPTPGGSLGLWRVWVFLLIPVVWWVATMLAALNRYG